jgi:LPS-assembly protein
MVSSASTHPPSSRRRRVPSTLSIVFAVAMAVAGVCLSAPRVQAQQMLAFPTRPTVTPPTTYRSSDKAPMLLKANEVHYDYNNKRVSAVGNVQVYYGGTTVEADRLIYDENTKRVQAEGNVRLTEGDGKITHAEVLNMSDDFRDGFVDSLRLETPDQTHMAASRADRSNGNFTVFNNGVYTACEPCKDDPKKPPLWQIKGKRIIHDANEKMIYFENAQVEFFGKPIAYLPYLSAPDPTVKRKTGFLIPTASYSTRYGLGLDIPYYWALAPDYDLTLSPRITTKQGPLLRGEWRQRFESGAYSIRLSGIRQLDPGYFDGIYGTGTKASNDFRGSIESSGQFAITDKWTWGWDTLLPTDPTFFQDYGLMTNQRGANPLTTFLPTEGVNQLYVVGKGDRSYFDARSIYYYGFSTADIQSQIPIIHPVIDYDYTFGRPVLGGELSYRVNLTSLSRDSAAYDPISSTAIALGSCTPTTAAPGSLIPANCLLRGIPGTYSRFSAETTWKRTITDSLGQQFTPFASLRADAATLSIRNQPGVSNYLPTGDSSVLRAMPTVGLEYRYPFISVHTWGTQTLEPIAQVIARPNESNIGKLPNEDSQSLIFDDSNLFRVDKYSGWDRVEGGGRANVGLQYTTQFNRGGFVNVLFGQSYQLFGVNSFAQGDITNTGLGSGLDTDRSDYVARVAYQPNRTYMFTTRYRFDQETFALRRFELEGRANFDRWSVSALYGSYDAQPQLGFLNRREGILGTTQIKLNANWVATAGVRYDLTAGKIDQTQFGIGYIDDCFILALNYISGYSYNQTTLTTTSDQRIMLQLSLRTIGSNSIGQTVSSATVP